MLGTRRIAKTPLLSRARNCRAPGPFPFARDGVSFWHRGQTALWQGINSLGFKEGARILMPAFNCGSEVDVLSKAGLEIDFYRLNDDLSPDLEHLDKLRRTGTSALYIIHYFGMAQPMAELLQFVKDHDLVLIEDAAPALYSCSSDGTPIGSFGDMSIFSIWKYLPVPDGGALFLKNADLPRDDSRQTTAPPRLLIAKTLMVKLVHEVLYRLPRWLYDPAKKKAAMRETENGNPDELEFPAEIGNWAMSGFSSFVATRVDHNSIRDRRIRNYSILDEHFETRDEIRPLFAALRNGSCPLFFPIWVADPADFTRHHYQHGGWCAPYWLATHPLLAKRSFPFEADLRKNVLVLPLHQDLKDRDMLRIADIVNRWQPD